MCISQQFFVWETFFCLKLKIWDAKTKVGGGILGRWGMGQIQLERDFVDLLSFFSYSIIIYLSLMEYYPYPNIRILFDLLEKFQVLLCHASLRGWRANRRTGALRVFSRDFASDVWGLSAAIMGYHSKRTSTYPWSIPQTSPNPKWKELLHKLLVGDPGCVPGICSKILRLMLWFPSQQALQWFEDSRQVVEYAEFLGMDLKTEMFGAPASMLHFLTLIMDFPFENLSWKRLQQDM